MTSRDPIQLGVFLASYFPAPQDTEAALQTIERRAELIEELKFDSLFLGHHLLSAAKFLQPLPLAAFLAARTERVKIGLGVYLLPLSNPLSFAEEVATISALSRNRLIVGVGAGYRKSEFRAVGVPFEDRFKRLEEYTSIACRLIDGETVTAVGSFGELSNAKVQLATSEARPEMWMGAFGDIGIRRCARLGMPWMAGPEGSLEILADRVRTYRAAAVEANVSLPQSLPLVRELYVGETDDEARAAAYPFLAKQYADYKSWDHGLTIEDLIERDAVVGSPSTVAKRLNQYRDLGFTHVVARSDWPDMDPELSTKSMELLAKHVRPMLV
jgi:alkanesulfonate monooxygenase SsuD/methylene tetrahydromethanopterin reductase-like flavin-dependent oxidoreductase (luciferase family)